jgi:hypothetical protein
LVLVPAGTAIRGILAAAIGEAGTRTIGLWFVGYALIFGWTW